MSKVSSMGRWAMAGAFGLALGGGALAARADDSSAAQKASSAASKSADKANQAADEAKEAAEKAGRQTRDTASEAADKTRDTASEAADKTRDTASEAADKTRDTASDTSARTKDTVDDSMITGKIKGGLATKGREAAGIDVESHNGVVTLTGTVSSESTRDAAVKAAKETKGVSVVNDEIDVRPQSEK